MNPTIPEVIPRPAVARSNRAQDRLRTALDGMIRDRRKNPVDPPDFQQTLAETTYADGAPAPDSVLVNRSATVGACPLWGNMPGRGRRRLRSAAALSDVLERPCLRGYFANVVLPSRSGCADGVDRDPNGAQALRGGVGEVLGLDDHRDVEVSVKEAATEVGVGDVVKVVEGVGQLVGQAVEVVQSAHDLEFDHPLILHGASSFQQVLPRRLRS